MTGPHKIHETFAIVSTADAAIDPTQVARTIADPLGVPLADLIQKQRSGILAERLSEPVAGRCVALSRAAGITVRAVPQSSVIELPEVVTVKSGRPDEAAFFYVGSKNQGVVKWDDVLWVDLVALQQRTFEKFNYVETGGAENDAVVEVRNPRWKPKQPIFVDLVCREPWLLLRIPQEPFDFAATGLTSFSSRRENIISLAAAIAAKASRARFGPGLKWMQSNAAPREHRVQSQALYDGFLRWQLTRLFLE